MPTKKYKPETYWDKVAENISTREDLKIIAGDDEPYYRYKRKLFLKLLNKIDFFAVAGVSSTRYLSIS